MLNCAWPLKCHASIAITRIDARIRAARPNSVGRGERSCPSVEKFMGDERETRPSVRWYEVLTRFEQPHEVGVRRLAFVHIVFPARST